MKKTNLIFTILIMFCAVSIVTAQKEPPPNDFVDNDPPINRGEIIAKELGLTKEQQVQIRQINQKSRIAMQEARQNLKKANDELDVLLYSDEVDQAILQTKIRAVADAHTEIVRIRVRSELAVRNVLTPEQIVKFRNLFIEFQEKQKERQLQRQNKRQMNQRNPINRPRQNQNRPN